MRRSRACLAALALALTAAVSACSNTAPKPSIAGLNPPVPPTTVTTTKVGAGVASTANVPSTTPGTTIVGGSATTTAVPANR
jgi:hypothetical protein